MSECNLWLNLAEMCDADKVCFLKASIYQAGLFGDTVEDFAQQQTETIKHILPRHVAPTTKQPQAGRQPVLRGGCLLAVSTPAPPWSESTRQLQASNTAQPIPLAHSGNPTWLLNSGSRFARHLLLWSQVQLVPARHSHFLGHQSCN